MFNKNDILQGILNKRNKQAYYTGTVSTLNPLKVKLYPGDDEIPVVSTTGLVNISVGSRLFLIKFQNQLVAIAVIGAANKLFDYVVKATSDSIYNTTTLSDDSELTLTLPANGVYSLELVLYLDGTSNTPDCKVAYNATNATIKGYRTAIGPGLNTSSVYNADAIHMNSKNFTQTGGYGITNAGWGTVFEKCIVETGSSDGTVTIQHAQNVATAEYIYIRAGSWFRYTRLDYNN